ncbi:hypothetical protein CYMTET_4293 [Cymbomonas tetramitiformis]|uniref:Uncharacterized protein n=1 Tax=Cymbomonas tetramitiformis TaxID=36881 RepID=A0AAE0H1M4_9CHLO|nr:hypothetical protein CYMTET_4293 [Cymbomonas tetramitiformis]
MESDAAPAEAQPVTVIPPLPASPKTLQQKFQLARQLEEEIQRRTQDWRNALGRDETNSLIFKHFKARALQIHGEQFDLSFFLGNLKTTSGIVSYTSHIFRHLTRFCAVITVEDEERVTVEDPAVAPTIERLTANFKNVISSENVLNVTTFLLKYDCYIPVLEATAAEVNQIEKSLRVSGQPAPGNTAPIPIPASPAFSLNDLDIQDELYREEAEDWEQIDSEGGYGSANLTGDFQSQLVDHEESGDFDPSAVLRAQKYADEISKRTEQVEGHEGDLSNEDFIQTVKITRMDKGDRRKFSNREISETTRQITQLLERHSLDISHLSVKGRDRPADLIADSPVDPTDQRPKDPFILVRVKSESEARVILEKAVYVIDDRRYISEPKSDRLVRFNINFVAAAANLQGLRAQDHEVQAPRGGSRIVHGQKKENPSRHHKVQPTNKPLAPKEKRKLLLRQDLVEPTSQVDTNLLQQSANCKDSKTSLLTNIPTDHYCLADLTA